MIALLALLACLIAGPETDLDRITERFDLTRVSEPATGRETLRGPGLTVTFAPGLRIALVNGEVIKLEAPVEISGAIVYTSEPHPMMRVYAVRTDGQHYQYVIAGQNDGQYSLTVPAGEYYILADVNVGDGVFEGGYTEMSKCLRDGGNCASAAHNLIAILAEAGQEIKDIDLRDWDVPAGIFPDVPG